MLSIAQEGSTFTEQKIAYPVDMPAGVSIGSLKGSAENNVMIGGSSAGLFLVDLANQVPPIANKHKINKNKIRGCASNLWIVGETNNYNKMFLKD